MVLTTRGRAWQRRVPQREGLRVVLLEHLLAVRGDSSRGAVHLCSLKPQRTIRLYVHCIQRPANQIVPRDQHVGERIQGHRTWMYSGQADG